MRVPMLNQCCCGCTLKTGTIIIGILNVIAGTWFLAIGIVQSSYKDDVTNDPEREDLIKVVHAVGAVAATVGALVLLTGALTCIGAMKNIPNLLLPYLVMAVLSIATRIITSSLAAAKLYDLNNSSQATSEIIGIIIYLALQVYFLLVVYSLYREQKGIVPTVGP